MPANVLRKRRGGRRSLADPPIKMFIHIPRSVANRLTAHLGAESKTGTVPYGKRSQLLTRLITQYLDNVQRGPGEPPVPMPKAEPVPTAGPLDWDSLVRLDPKDYPEPPK